MLQELGFHKTAASRKILSQMSDEKLLKYMKRLNMGHHNVFSAERYYPGAKGVGSAGKRLKETRSFQELRNLQDRFAPSKTRTLDEISRRGLKRPEMHEYVK